jgi:hypothetical protein
MPGNKKLSAFFGRLGTLHTLMYLTMWPGGYDLQGLRLYKAWVLYRSCQCTQPDENPCRDDYIVQQALLDAKHKCTWLETTKVPLKRLHNS